MTIAIGLLCQDGLIVAADTKMSYSDGTTYYTEKVETAFTLTGSYVMAYSSADANSAQSLISRIKSEMLFDPKSLSQLEAKILTVMSAFHSSFAFGDDRSTPELIIGASIESNATNKQSELALYFCQPPNTIVSKTLNNCGGYIAIGHGRVITDSIFKTLFKAPASTHDCLCQVSYLMYMAKEHCANSCGGDTDAVFIRKTHEKPAIVKRIDIKVGESISGRIDNALHRTASAVISDKDWGDPEGVLDLAGDINNLGLVYRRLKFHSETGEIIS